MDGWMGGWVDGWMDCGVRTSEATRTVAHHAAVLLLERVSCLDGSTNEPNPCNFDEILYLR